ncbi:MAG: type II secretion system minor pseudopilin GspK [Brachymonas sp.]|nr:type II secretion system minor pseudopilin GspK [Brachymonas sp.]
MHKGNASQRGAALLLAMLIVALVAVLAASAVWQQWRSTTVEVSERGRLQANWILAGALDWARLILAEDAKAGGPDHLSEPWAVPLMEARLTTFLAAERNVTVDTSNLPEDAFLSGRIDDMQGRFNLWNLVKNNELSAPDVAALQRLFAQVGLSESEAQQLAQQWLRSARAWARPAADPGAAPLPRQVNQLGWLGVSASNLARISPYITILPERTAINANTASSQVLAAARSGGSMAEAQSVLTYRNRQPFVNLEALEKVLPTRPQQVELGVASRYFMVQGKLRVGSVTIQQQALVQRDGGGYGKILWREIGSFTEDEDSLARQQ